LDAKLGIQDLFPSLVDANAKRFGFAAMIDIANPDFVSARAGDDEIAVALGASDSGQARPSRARCWKSAIDGKI
jgi:hypothetical protein